jgi:hypothetical protein
LRCARRYKTGVRAAKTGGEKDIGFRRPSSDAIEWRELQRGRGF